MASPHDSGEQAPPAGQQRSNPISSASPPIFPLEEPEPTSYSNENPKYGDDDEYCEIRDDYGSAALESFCERSSGGNVGKSGEQQQPQQHSSTSFRWIRRENEVDESIRLLTSPQDVLQRIQHVREQQARLGKAQLYPRRWEYRNHRKKRSENEEAVNRESFPAVVNGDRGTDDGGEGLNGCDRCHSFSILQFNTLAEGLSQGPSSKVPFRLDPTNTHGQQETQSYGGFTDIPFPEETLGFDARRWRLLEVLLGGGFVESSNHHDQRESPLGLAAAYDIIAAEEMDRYWGFFAPLLRNIFGYRGIFAPKTRSPGVRMGWYSDGCALFWKEHKFELLAEKRLEYKVGNQVMVLATLRHKASQKPIVVAVTHLKAQDNEANERVRVAQVQELLLEIEQKVGQTRELLECDDVPVVIAGDFNADPPHRCTHPNGGSSIAQLLATQHQRQKIGFRSSYPQVETPNDESFYTTYKIRGPKTTRRVIDYIFYRSTLKERDEDGKEALLECEATLSIPNESELDETFLPSLRHPSDHLEIGAIFKLL